MTHDLLEEVIYRIKHTQRTLNRLTQCLEYPTYTIGLHATGVIGSNKSILLEQIAVFLRKQGHEVTMQADLEHTLLIRLVEPVKSRTRKGKV